MKGIGVELCLCGFLLLFCIVDRFSFAIEAADVDAKLTTMPEANSNMTTKTPPDLGKSVEKGGSNQEKKPVVENEKKHEKQINSSTDKREQDSEKDPNMESSAEKKDMPSEKNRSGVDTSKNANSESHSNKVSVEDSFAEGCDSSNRCIDEKNKFVACLRVPGKDLDLSLLIQNKGEKVLNVNITVPVSVKLEETEIVLQEKENKEVKVNIGGVANDPTIMLAGDVNCNLSYSSMILDSAQQSSRVAKYLNLPTRTSTTTMLVLAGAIIIIALSCIRYWRMRRQESISKYQKVEVALPISTGGSKDSDETDGWDDSWGDGWDDEETPKTPSKLVSTPSSKGLASRKMIKDGWKD